MASPRTILLLICLLDWFISYGQEREEMLGTPKSRQEARTALMKKNNIKSVKVTNASTPVDSTRSDSISIADTIIFNKANAGAIYEYSFAEYHQNGMLKNRTEYFSLKRNMTKYSMYDSLGNVLIFREYSQSTPGYLIQGEIAKYDDQSRLIMMIKLKSGLNQGKKQRTKYINEFANHVDLNSLASRKQRFPIYFKKNDMVVYRVYNDQNDLIGERGYNKKGGVPSYNQHGLRYIILNQYDDQNNLINITTYSSQTLDTSYTDAFSYDEQNRLIKKVRNSKKCSDCILTTVDYSDNGAIVIEGLDKHMYRFDNRGNLITDSISAHKTICTYKYKNETPINKTFNISRTWGYLFYGWLDGFNDTVLSMTREYFRFDTSYAKTVYDYNLQGLRIYAGQYSSSDLLLNGVSYTYKQDGQISSVIDKVSEIKYYYKNDLVTYKIFKRPEYIEVTRYVYEYRN